MQKRPLVFLMFPDIKFAEMSFGWVKFKFFDGHVNFIQDSNRRVSY